MHLNHLTQTAENHGRVVTWQLVLQRSIDAEEFIIRELGINIAELHALRALVDIAVTAPP